MPLRRVVVTGIGLVTPLGVGRELSWNRLIRGQSGISRIPQTGLWSTIPSKVAAFVPKKISDDQESEGLYDDSVFNSSENKYLSLGMKFGLVAAEEALKDAAWQPERPEDRMRTGVAVGMAMVDSDYITECNNLVSEGKMKKVGPHYVPKVLTNMVAGHISIRHKLRGPNHSVATACATGSHAIGDAFRMIQFRAADVMVCGGVEACITPLNVSGFCRARALSTKNYEDPSLASRPFDKDRDGFIIGEGGGILILEELEHALARGANIYAEIVGYGLSGDAEHMTAGRQDGEGALQAMRGAFQDVGFEAIKDLWHINVHATSTPLGDRAEITALNKLLEIDSFIKPLVSSNKGSIGHLLGGAGSVESAFAVLSLNRGIVPKSLNLNNLDEDCKSDRLNFVTHENFTLNISESKSDRRLVLKNSFGFGGTNVSLLFSSYSL